MKWDDWLKLLTVILGLIVAAANFVRLTLEIKKFSGKEAVASYIKIHPKFQPLQNLI
jgi:hypothetical protein